ncbi:MAG: efflux RND transporter periplasmic adaptor subunit, partial [candidate division NC10 bacterium]
EIEEARERLRSATATRALAEADLRRLETLKARELIAAQEADRGRQAFEVAAAQERSAKESLDMLVEGSRAHQVEAARALRESTQNRLALLLAGPRPHQREAARAALREAQAALTLVRERHADTVITSPLDGHVVSRDLEPGATVNSGTTILKVTDPRTFWVTVHVDERETGGIGAGDAADITLRSLAGRTLPGRVARVRRESDRVTEQLAVDVAFVEAPGRLTLGEQAEATIRPAPRKGVAALPLLAVIRGRGGLGVWSVSGGRLGWRTVELGAADASGWAEVRAGLRAGEQVVVSPGR